MVNEDKYFMYIDEIVSNMKKELEKRERHI